ncbi:MAG: hypothetical protein KF691_00500 [Phycisphaeraceae bacterium]|nr:hypothetical protein [Phycisphaeraceae bacterium]
MHGIAANFRLFPAMLCSALIAIAGCETSHLASHAAFGPSLRAEQISFRGPIEIAEHQKGRENGFIRLQSDDPLITELNLWAQQALAGAKVDIVNYAPGTTVRGTGFKLNFKPWRVVVDIWNESGPVGSWSKPSDENTDRMLEALTARLHLSE